MVVPCTEYNTRKNRRPDQMEKKSDQSASTSTRKRNMTDFQRHVHLTTRDMFLLVLCLLVTVDGAGANKCVEEDLKAKVDHANVVVSGTIERKYPSNDWNGLYPCDLKVMLLFKGKGLVTSNKLKISNNVIRVDGFGNEHICNSNVHLSDTKLFFLSCDGKTTQLKSGILPVTLETLQITEEVSKSKYYSS